jgi:hypothetical protein
VKVKQEWGKFYRTTTRILGIPVRITVEIPYDWYLSHTNEHAIRYWKRKRGEKK